MNGLALGFAVSPRDWADRFHRFLADHGGARVRVHVLHPDDATEEHFDVLLIDDICSFLTPRFVARVRGRGRRVVGIYERSRPEGKDRLAECGIDVIVDAAADPEEFLRAVMVAAEGLGASGESEPTVPEVTETATAPGRLAVVAGPAGGCGVTEVAVALAFASRGGNRPVCLVDADPVHPSVGPRLGLAPHPNLRTAVDELEHRGSAPTPIDCRGVAVLPGGVPPRALDGVRPGQVLDLIGRFAGDGTDVVVDAGTRLVPADGSLPGLAAALVEAADVIVAVGAASPVGVIRLLEWLATLKAVGTRSPVFVAFNRAPRSPYRRGELLEEVVRSFPSAGFAFLPHDPNVDEAAWRGVPVDRGRFVRSVGRLAGRLGRELVE